jgi:hypothetical protein
VSTESYEQSFDLDGVRFTAWIEVEDDDAVTPGSVTVTEISGVNIKGNDLPEWVVYAIEETLREHAWREASRG